MIPLRELANPNDAGVRLYWSFATQAGVAAQFTHVQLRHATKALLVEAIYAQAIGIADLVDIFTTAIALPAGVAGTARNRDFRVAATGAVTESATNVAKQTDGVASFAPVPVPLGNALTPLLSPEGHVNAAVRGPLVLTTTTGIVVIPQAVANGITVYFAYRELQ
ncbi:MAG: hypothetical protein ACREVM_04885 [Burkholderiales bacterium]